MRTALAAVFTFSLSLPGLAADIGKPSPEFTINRAGGAPAISLNQYRGKIVALAFIHTTCPHCQNLTRELGPIAKEYAPKGVQFIECAFNPGAAGLVTDFAIQYQPPFPVGWNTDVGVRSYLGISILDARPMYVPHMVFIDRRGIVRSDYPGESPFFGNPEANIRAELDRLLKASPAPASSARTKKK